MGVTDLIDTTEMYLRTVYGCGSACISFVDDMMRCPGGRACGAATPLERGWGG